MLIGILAGLYCRIDEFLEILDQCHIRLILNVLGRILSIFNEILLVHSVILSLLDSRSQRQYRLPVYFMVRNSHKWATIFAK